MSQTDSSGVPTPTDSLTVTVPADLGPLTGHAVVLHTPVDGVASAPLASAVPWCAVACSEMPDVSATRGVQLTSDAQV